MGCTWCEDIDVQMSFFRKYSAGEERKKKIKSESQIDIIFICNSRNGNSPKVHWNSKIAMLNIVIEWQTVYSNEKETEGC